MDTWLPLIDTILIGISAVAATIGYLFIRTNSRRFRTTKVRYHRASMITAAAFAAAFLFLYVYRWAFLGTKFFTGHGLARGVYLSVLATHIVLATVLGPLVLVVLYRALTRQFPRHKHLARRTLPIWIYVAATGWLIYLMLYQISWTASTQARR
ncbi:MAG TPA: DUF420 domain-containing protein [Thermomicrobiaceae bacterium]|nr:DUF420 domain-containing protein [Thermomicrobiaceae bacterium]